MQLGILGPETQQGRGGWLAGLNSWTMGPLEEEQGGPFRAAELAMWQEVLTFPRDRQMLCPAPKDGRGV